MAGAELPTAQRLALLRRHLEEGIPLTVAAADAGVPVRTVRRWLSQYRSGGPAAVGPASRADRGQRKLDAQVVAAIEGMALRKPPPSIAHIHREITRVSVSRGSPPPSYTTVQSIVHALDPGMLTLAHRGPAAYRDKYELVYRREAARPNEQWQADHTELDVMILDPAGRTARPWLTVILDDRSRAVAGYTVFLGAPTAMQTALALRQAVWRKNDPTWPVCGLPEVLYSDHGADFTSAHLDQVCADTHIQLIHSTPGVPQGRGKIERFFGTLTTELLPTLPGHIPHGTRGQPVTPPGLTLAELDAALGRFIVHEYHQRIHSTTGERPTDRWAAGGWLPRMPDSLAQLDLLLLTIAKPRKVHRDGVHCHGLRYLDLTLAAYVGEDVTVRYDPRDLAEIRIYHQDSFLCSALAPELAADTISLKDLQAARTRRRRDLRTELQQRRSLADAITANARNPIPANAARTPRRTPAADTETAPVPQQHSLRLYLED